jgi:hypothetical protein
MNNNYFKAKKFFSGGLFLFLFSVIYNQWKIISIGKENTFLAFLLYRR